MFRDCSRWVMLLALVISSLWITCSKADTCPSLVPFYCSTSSNCNGGVCERGVCRSCPSGKIGELCASNDVFLNLGNVAITQAGLDFAPVEYFNPINNAYEEAKANSLSATAYTGTCTNNNGNSQQSYKVDLAALTQSQFTKSDLIPSSIKFEITSDGLRVSATGDYAISKARLNLWGGAYCCPCTGADCTDFFCPKVCSQTDSNDWIDFTFQATVRANIALAYSASVQGVVATVYGVVLEFDDSSLGAVLHCPTQPYQLISNTVKSYFEEVKSQIAPTLTPSITAALTKQANIITARYQGVQSYTASPGVYIIYKVTNLTVVTGTYIAMDLQGKIKYTFFHNYSSLCQINVTYADTATDTALLPPRSWKPVTKLLSPSGLYSPLLAGVRLTRSFFNGIVWAMYQDPGDRARTFTLKASNGLAAVTKVTFSVPFFRIPNDAQQGRLRVSIDATGTMSCPPQQTGTVLSANVNQLDASFSLAYDDTPSNPAIAFQVLPGFFSVGSVQNNIVSIDPVLNNPTLLKSAIEGGLNFNAPALNAYLLENGNGVLTLPPDLRTSFPDAQLQIISQGNAGAPAINGESGYIEMVNRCACSSSSEPISGQGVDGIVNVCLASFLSKSYCTSISQSRRRRRRLETGAMDIVPSSTKRIPSSISRETSKLFRILLKQEMRNMALRSASKPSSVEVEGSSTLRAASRKLSTPQQEADLTTVIGSLGTTCVTRAPTKTPTTPRPTKVPTKRPTHLPTTFDGLDASRDVCKNGLDGCYYERDVLLFVCPTGYTEVQSCRYQNSDIYCCPEGASATLRVSTNLVAVLIIAILALIFH